MKYARLLRVSGGAFTRKMPGMRKTGRNVFDEAGLPHGEADFTGPASTPERDRPNGRETVIDKTCFRAEHALA